MFSGVRSVQSRMNPLKLSVADLDKFEFYGPFPLQAVHN